MHFPIWIAISPPRGRGAAVSVVYYGYVADDVFDAGSGS